MSQSKVSDLFLSVMAVNTGAIEEARTAEKRAFGIQIPKGTRGKAELVSMNADKEPDKEENGVPKPGRPYLEFKLLVHTPTEHQGQQINGRRFYMTVSPKMSVAQKFGQALDYLMDCGMTKEDRLQITDITKVVAWIDGGSRMFNYEIEEDVVGGNKYKNATPQGMSEAGLPGPTQTQSATWNVNDPCLVSGNDAVVLSIGADGSTAKVRILATNMEVEQQISTLQPKV